MVMPIAKVPKIRFVTVPATIVSVVPEMYPHMEGAVDSSNAVHEPVTAEERVYVPAVLAVAPVDVKTADTNVPSGITQAPVLPATKLPTVIAPVAVVTVSVEVATEPAVTVATRLFEKVPLHDTQEESPVAGATVPATQVTGQAVLAAQEAPAGHLIGNVENCGQ